LLCKSRRKKCALSNDSTYVTFPTDSGNLGILVDVSVIASLLYIL